MRILNYLILLFFLGLSQLALAANDNPDLLERKYTIVVQKLSLEKNTISAKMTVNLFNRGKKPIHFLIWTFYPNRFQEELPYLNDINFRRIYPSGVSRGSLTIQRMVENGKSLLPTLNEPAKNLPDNVFVRTNLSSPLQPGEEKIVEIEYTVVIPEKFGSFGRYNGVFTLAGGWYPYVVTLNEAGFQTDHLPPKALFEVQLGIDSDMALMGEWFIGERKQTIDRRYENKNEISLLLTSHLKKRTIADRQGEVQYAWPSQISIENRPLEELIVRWFDFVHDQPEFQDRRVSTKIVIAPIRESMIVKGDGLIFLSDRAFKVFPGMRQYHSMPILHALFYQLVVEDVRKRETNEDWRWVADAVAWNWIEKFTKGMSYENVDARTLGPIRYLSFLYTIDQLIYAPQFAFYDVFYNYVYPFDPVRDDPLFFNHDRPQGRTIFAHMQDFLREEVAGDIAGSYLQEAPLPLLGIMEKQTHKKLEAQFENWKKPEPILNLKLESVHKKKVESGYETEIKISKKTDRPWAQPVELYAKTKDEKVHLLKWDGEGDEHIFHLNTEKPLNVVEIDPRRRLLETHLSDNRSPPYYKVVLTDYALDYDFNDNQPIGFVFGEIRQTYGGFNRYTFGASYDVKSYGVGFGYTRLFGRFLDSLRLSHAFHVGYNFSLLSEDQVLTTDPENSANQKVVLIGKEQYQSAITFSYFFGDQLSITNPLRGGYSSFDVTWGNSYLGGESDYYQASWNAAWIIPFHPNYFLALRGILGTSGPGDIPSRVQYSLGGISAMRGLSVSDDRFIGRNLLLLSGEFRHMLLKDIDINCWLFRIRDIQGALFSDTGRATDTVQEQATQVAYGTSNHTTFGDLFDVSEFSSDVGYGIRFLVDYFGVNPGIIRFDAAKSLSEKDQGVRFYFAVAQSF